MEKEVLAVIVGAAIGATCSTVAYLVKTRSLRQRVIRKALYEVLRIVSEIARRHYTGNHAFVAQYVGQVSTPP